MLPGWLVHGSREAFEKALLGRRIVAGQGASSSPGRLLPDDVRHAEPRLSAWERKLPVSKTGDSRFESWVPR